LNDGEEAAAAGGDLLAPSGAGRDQEAFGAQRLGVARHLRRPWPKTLTEQVKAITEVLDAR
jgi:hypothetical protein